VVRQNRTDSIGSADRPIASSPGVGVGRVGRLHFVRCEDRFQPAALGQLGEETTAIAAGNIKRMFDAKLFKPEHQIRCH